VNWKDPQGVSILHCLAYGDLEAPMKLLIEHNADVNIRNKVRSIPRTILEAPLFSSHFVSTTRLHFIGLRK
jgi:hypothetical protein